MQSLLWKAVGCNHCDVNCIKKVGLETMMRLVSHRQTAWCLCARLRCPDVTLTCAFCPALTVETQQVRRLQAEHHRHGNPQPAARHQRRNGNVKDAQSHQRRQAIGDRVMQRKLCGTLARSSRRVPLDLRLSLQTEHTAVVSPTR